MAKYLLKFGIAGVQEFISQSRKIRDLDAASEIISALSRAAGTTLSETEILLPARISENTVWPHQIVCRIQKDSHKEVRELASNVVSRVVEAWQAMAAAAYDRHRSLIGISKDIFTQASEDWLEIYWVVIQETGDYAGDFSKVSALYDDRRLTRTVRPLTQFALQDGNSPWICSLCGKRPSVLKTNIAKSDSARFITGKERLCATCLTKRHQGLMVGDKAPSTHSLAKYRFFSDSAFDSFRQPFVDLNWNRILDVIGTEQEEGLSDTLKCGLDTLKGCEAFEKLPAYYGIVALDGDQMGKWVSGENLEFKDTLEIFQKILSGRILEASRQFQKLSDCFNGVHVVYAGGDDALLLTPIDCLLPLITQIKSIWDRSLCAGWEKKLMVKGNKVPSLSLHASIVQAKSPLQPTLREAMENLLRTKNLGRNRFSIAVYTSGAPFQIIADWPELSKLTQAVQAFCDWRLEDNVNRPSDSKILEQRDLEKLPMKLGHSLFDTRIFFTITSKADGAKLLSKTGYEREIKRIFRHSGAGKIAQEKWEKAILEWLASRAENRLSAEDGGEICGQELAESALKTCLFLARTLCWKGDDE